MVFINLLMDMYVRSKGFLLKTKKQRREKKILTIRIILDNQPTQPFLEKFN